MKPFLEIKYRIVKILLALIWCISTAPVIFVYFYTEKFAVIDILWWNFVSKPKYNVMLVLMVVFFLVSPMLLITILNVLLAITAIRNSALTQKKYNSLIVTCCLSGLFIFSWLPFIISMFCEATGTPQPLGLRISAFHCIYLNCCGNPVIYTFTCRRFCSYVKNIVTCDNKTQRQSFEMKKMSTTSRS